MLVMDDNKILPEWLAYHYHVLPLRRLIIATDPYSMTSPKPILDAYQDQLGLNVSIWTDANFHRNGTTRWTQVSQSPNLTSRERQEGFVWRQTTFYTECAMQLKREGQHKWVIIMDSDEYISYNFYNDTVAKEKKPAQRVCQRVSFWADDTFKCRSDGEAVHMMRYLGIPFPDTIVGSSISAGTKSPATISHFIHQYWNDSVIKIREGSDVCDVLPRIQIGVKNSSIPLPAAAATSLPETFHANQFRTISNREHNEMRNNLPGKAMLNLQNWRGNQRIDIHRGPASLLCFNAKKSRRPEPSLSFFRIHHYTGSLEEFMSRPGDTRRTAAIFAERNEYHVAGNTNEVTVWLSSFIKQVGPKRALYLTEGLRKWATANDAAVAAASSKVAW